MKTNGDKCHLIVSTNKLTEIQIAEFSIKSSGSENLLGVNIDSKFNFKWIHVNDLRKKANKKLRAEKMKTVMNSFFNAQFNYCPLFECFTVVKIIIKPNIYMYVRCLRLIYSGKKSSYEKSS